METKPSLHNQQMAADISGTAEVMGRVVTALIEGFTPAIKRLNEAAKQMQGSLLKLTEALRKCDRCAERVRDLDGVDARYCSECEDTLRMRVYAGLLVSIILLSVVAVLLR